MKLSLSRLFLLGFACLLLFIGVWMLNSPSPLAAPHAVSSQSASVPLKSESLSSSDRSVALGNLATIDSSFAGRSPKPKISDAEQLELYNAAMPLLFSWASRGVPAGADHEKLTALLGNSPAEAIAWVETLTPLARRKEMELALALQWGATGLAGAWEWAQYTGDDSNIVGVLLGGGSVGADIAKLAGAWLKSDDSRSRIREEGLIGSLDNAKAWESALGVIFSLRPERQEPYVRSILSSVAARDPEKALRMAEQIADPVLHAAGRAEIFGGWSYEKLPELARVAFALPVGEERELATAKLAVKLIESEQDTVDWIDQYPELKALHNQGAALMAQRIDGLNVTYGAAIKWVNTIQDLKHRYAAITRIVESMAPINRNEALSYVQSVLGLDEAQRVALTQIVDSRARTSSGR